MADIELIKPRELPEQANVQATDALMVDNGTVVGKATPEKIVNAGAPVASEAEALAGVNNTKRMTPLRVRQVLDNVNNPAVLRAQAWAESSTPPDPLLPDSKSAKTWAGVAKEYADKAEQGTVMVQWSMIAEEGQTVLGNDITTGEPIRAYGGVAQISVNGFGPITPEEYSVDSDGVVTLTAPLAEGDVVSGFTQPRLSNSEAQAVVQGVLQQTGADVAAAQEAAARAEAASVVAQSRTDIVLTTAFGMVGATLDTLTYSTAGITDGVTVRAGDTNALWEVLPASASVYDYIGSAGVKYRVEPVVYAPISVRNYVNLSGEAVAPSAADNRTGLQAAVQRNEKGGISVPSGTYRVNGKVGVTSQPISIHGNLRVESTLQNTENSGPTLEISGAQTGNLESIGFRSGTNTGPQISLTNYSHMWILNELLFRSCAGSAILVADSWDMWWSDIDILSCAQDGSASPRDGAAFIVRNDLHNVNNLHVRGLRIEKPANAGIYWEGQGFVTGGKIDRGFTTGPTPTQPCLILNGGDLVLRDYLITGSRNGQPAISAIGDAVLRAENCQLDGGIAAVSSLVELGFTREHTISNPDSLNFRRPVSGRIEFVSSVFSARHPSVSSVVDAVVGGKTASNIYVANTALATRPYNASGGYHEITLTGVTGPANGWADGCTLVNAVSGKRYFIAQTFLDGKLRVYMPRNDAEFVIGDLYRIEYMPQEADRVEFIGCEFRQEIMPFATYGAKLSLSSVSYDIASATTTATLSGGTTSGFTGYFLFDRGTRRQYRIEAHSAGIITLNGDLSVSLTGPNYDVVAGAYISARVNGPYAEWMAHDGLRRMLLSDLRDGRRSVDQIYPYQDGVVV